VGTFMMSLFAGSPARVKESQDYTIRNSDSEF
jgi:hypothetical protein